MRNTYLVLFIYLMIPMFSLAENTYTTQQREDSLLSLLKSSPAINEQIELYKDLATMYRQTPKEIVYLNKMSCFLILRMGQLIPPLLQYTKQG